ncbi:MAG: hypothetical protein V1822_01130 [Candidatus Micrarchaeota archaeon]
MSEQNEGLGQEGANHLPEEGASPTLGNILPRLQMPQATLRHPLARAGKITKKISMRLNGSPKEWAKSLCDCGFNSLEQKSSSLIATKIESYDFSQNPHSYVCLHFQKGSMELTYTLLDAQNPALRNLQAAHIALLALSAIGGSSLSPQFCAYISNSLSDAQKLITPAQASLEHDNSKMGKTIRELEEKLAFLYAQKDQDARSLLEAAKRSEKLEGRLSELEKIPDSALDSLALSWLTSHDGQICVQEFCQEHKITPARLEESLDRLCKQSRIKRV